MSGVILLPTLNRIELLKNFIKSCKETEIEIPLWILVDENDYQHHKDAYESVLPAKMGRLFITKGISMGDKCREVYPHVKDQFSWISLLNDDHYCLTPHWDKIIDGLIDGTNMVSSNDGGWNFGLNVVGVTAWSTPLLEACGFPIFPPLVSHWFIDNIFKAIGEKTGCWRETMKVNIEHRHVFCGKMPIDDTAKLSQDQAKANHAAQMFQKFMDEEFEGVCERISKLRESHTLKNKFV